MTVYECGNYAEENECPHCGAGVREEQPGAFETVSVDCPGWYD